MTTHGCNVFPFPGGDADRYDSEMGMSLREHYAGLAMQAIIAHGKTLWEADTVAEHAFKYAAAMVKQAESIPTR